MFYMDCEEYYTDYLGDNCDKRCEECCGKKEIYVAKEDFEVMGESILHTVLIEKGSWYWIKHDNPKDGRKLLVGRDGSRLHMTKEMFEKRFE